MPQLVGCADQVGLTEFDTLNASGRAGIPSSLLIQRSSDSRGGFSTLMKSLQMRESCQVYTEWIRLPESCLGSRFVAIGNDRSLGLV